MRLRIEEITAAWDPSLEARLGPTQPLLYAGAGSALVDPPFVRAASATRRWFERRVVIQDDVNVIAVGALAAGAGFDALLLPPGADGRRRFDAPLGNKALKLDLEAAVVLPDGRLLAFGSGSTRARERLVVVTGSGEVRLVEASALYAALRAEAAFAGSELNIEGALVVGDVLKLVQRGNGAPSPKRRPVNAIGDLPLAPFLQWLDGAGAVPALGRIARFELGRSAGAPLSFTDAALCADGSIACLACAEDSPDAVQDGAVQGCYFGLLDEAGLRLTPVLEEAGQPSLLKLEGLEPQAEDAALFDVVADVDCPDVPALGAVLRVSQR